MARLPELAVLDVEEHPLGWLVFWQSVEYIRSRDIGKMLMGHRSNLVDRQDGSIHHVPVTTFVGEGWEDRYLQQVRGVRPPDPLITDFLDRASDGTMAAIRHLRRRPPLLGPQITGPRQSCDLSVPPSRGRSVPPVGVLARVTWFGR